MGEVMELTDRVRRLERANGRWRLAGLAALALGAAVVLMGQASPETIPLFVKARAFQLVDSAGTAVGGLTVSPSGAPTLGLADKSGKVRLKLAVTPDGSSSLDLLDAAGLLRLEVIQMSDGSAGISLLDKSLVTRARMAIGADGTPALALAGADGRLVPLGVPAPPTPATR